MVIFMRAGAAEGSTTMVATGHKKKKTGKKAAKKKAAAEGKVRCTPQMPTQPWLTPELTFTF